MDGFSILNAPVLDAESVKQTPDYQAGHALGWLYRGNKQAATQHPLAGRLHIAQSGWLLLSVPNALVRGVYDALTAPGTELPLAGTLNVPNVKPDVLNAHISVMTAEEVDRIGADKISERGHMFRYALGPLQEIPVHNVEGVSKIWAIQVAAPELAALRKSYGLAPYPKNHPFHITVAVRRKGVLQDNNVSKFDAPNSRGELKAAAAKQANDPIDFDQWHGKAFKIVTTPAGKSVVSHTDGTPIADEPGRVSIVTPENGAAWNWPDAPAETVSNFRKNWGSIQGGIAGYKMDQIRRGMQSQPPAKQQNTPPPRPVHTSSSAPITAPKTAADAKVTYDCSCSGKCMCPPTCVCKRYCGCETKNASDAPWATFVVAPHAKGYAATTRPTGDGKFGLPGGKLEPGEDPLAAAAREASEEGWDVTDLHPEPLHKADVDGKPVWWYRAGGAKQREDFKEKGRVLPTVAKAKQLTEFGNDVALKAYRAAMRPPRPDLTKLAPKWSDRDHLLAALPKHLDDTRAALGAQGDVDKEMTDLALIAQAWLKSQKQKDLLAARLKKFQETAAYPSLAAPKTAAAYTFEGDVQGVSLRKTLHKILEELNRPGLAYNNAHTGEALAVLPGSKKQQTEVLNLLRQRLADRAAENAQRTGRPGEAKYKRPLQEGVDYKITPRPNVRERMHPVHMTPEAVQDFVRAQGFDRLGAEHAEYQKQWLGERYRLRPDAEGNLTGAVPLLAKKQLLHGEPIYGYQTVPGWKDKAAAADPDASILVSGHSGAGKSTLSKALAEKLKLPLISADKHPDFGAFFSKPGRIPGAETIVGTPEYEEFQTLRKRVGEETLANTSGPAVIEGIQLSALPPEQLQQYRQRVYVQTPIKQLLRQRFERQRNRATQKGNPWPEEELKSRYEIGRKIYDVQKPLMDNYAKLPGTLKYRPYKDDVDALIARLKKSAADKLPGGEADGVPDSKFPPKALAEGADHEHEHTDDDQIAKEIAKDHLSEDPRYYEKQKEVEKGAEHSGLLRELQQAKAHSDAKRYAHKHEILRRLMAQAPQDWEVDDDKPKYKGVTHKPTKFRFHTAPITIPPSVKKAMQDGGAAPGYQTPQQAPSVYWGQLKNLATMRQPLRYDYNKTVFDNVRDHLQAVKQRGDFMLQANRNYEQYRAAVDPMYRQELARRAVMGDMPQQNWFDQSVQMYGDHTLNTIFGAPK